MATPQERVPRRRTLYDVLEKRKDEYERIAPQTYLPDSLPDTWEAPQTGTYNIRNLPEPEPEKEIRRPEPPLPRWTHDKPPDDTVHGAALDQRIQSFLDRPRNERRTELRGEALGEALTRVSPAIPPGRITHETQEPKPPGPLARFLGSVPSTEQRAANKLQYQAEQQAIQAEREAARERFAPNREIRAEAEKLLSQYGVPTAGPGGERTAYLAERLIRDPETQRLVTGPAADVGITGWSESVGRMMRMSGDILGSETLRDWGEQLTYASQVAQSPDMMIQRDEIESPQDMVDYIIQTVSAGAGSMAPVFAGMAVGGGIGGAVAGPPGAVVGGIAGSMFAAFPLMFGETAQALEAEGITGPAADATAVVAGTIGSLLEIAVPLRMGSKMIPGAEKAVSRSFVQALVATAKEVGIEATAEALTEATQNPLPAVSQALLTEGEINQFTDPDFWIDTGIAAAVGALLGGAAGMVGGSSSVAHEQNRYNEVQRLTGLLNEQRPESAQLTPEDVDFGYDLVLDILDRRARAGKPAPDIETINAIYEEVLAAKAAVEAAEAAQEGAEPALAAEGLETGPEAVQEPRGAEPPPIDWDRIDRINEDRAQRGEEPFTREYVEGWHAENEQRRDRGERRRIDQLPPEKIEEINATRAEKGLPPLVQRPVMQLDEPGPIEGSEYLSSESGGTRDTPQLRAAAKRRAKKKGTTVEQELQERDARVRERLEKEHADYQRALNLMYDVLENLDEESRQRIVDEWDKRVGPKSVERLGGFLAKRGLARYNTETKAFEPTYATEYAGEEPAGAPEAPTQEPTPTTPQPEAPTAAPTLYAQAEAEFEIGYMESGAYNYEQEGPEDTGRDWTELDVLEEAVKIGNAKREAGTLTEAEAEELAELENRLMWEGSEVVEPEAAQERGTRRQPEAPTAEYHQRYVVEEGTDEHGNTVFVVDSETGRRAFGHQPTGSQTQEDARRYMEKRADELNQRTDPGLLRKRVAAAIEWLKNNPKPPTKKQKDKRIGYRERFDWGMVQPLWNLWYEGHRELAYELEQELLDAMNERQKELLTDDAGRILPGFQRMPFAQQLGSALNHLLGNEILDSDVAAYPSAEHFAHVALHRSFAEIAAMLQDEAEVERRIAAAREQADAKDLDAWEAKLRESIKYVRESMEGYAAEAEAAPQEAPAAERHPVGTVREVNGKWVSEPVGHDAAVFETEELARAHERHWRGVRDPLGAQNVANTAVKFDARTTDDPTSYRAEFEAWLERAENLDPELVEPGPLSTIINARLGAWLKGSERDQSYGIEQVAPDLVPRVEALREKLTAQLAEMEKTGGPLIPSVYDEVRVEATPKARELAEEAGIALVGIAGSGKNGKITVNDVNAAIKEQQAAVEPEAGPEPVAFTAGAKKTAEEIGVDLSYIRPGARPSQGPGAKFNSDDVLLVHPWILERMASVAEARLGEGHELVKLGDRQYAVRRGDETVATSTSENRAWIEAGRAAGIDMSYDAWEALQNEQQAEQTAAQETAEPKQPATPPEGAVNFVDAKLPNGENVSEFPFLLPCPHCGAKAGSPCIRPSGHRASSPHAARAQAVDALFEEMYPGMDLQRTEDGRFFIAPPGKGIEDAVLVGTMTVDEIAAAATGRQAEPEPEAEPEPAPEPEPEAEPVEVSDTAMSVADELMRSGKARVDADLLPEVYEALRREWEIDPDVEVADTAREPMGLPGENARKEWALLELRGDQGQVTKIVNTLTSGEDVTVDTNVDFRSFRDGPIIKGVIAEMDKLGYEVRVSGNIIRAREKLPAPDVDATDAEIWQQGWDHEMSWYEGGEFDAQSKESHTHYAAWAGIRRVIENDLSLEGGIYDGLLEEPDAEMVMRIVQALDQMTRVDPGSFTSFDKIMAAFKKGADAVKVEGPPPRGASQSVDSEIERNVASKFRRRDGTGLIHVVLEEVTQEQLDEARKALDRFESTQADIVHQQLADVEILEAFLGGETQYSRTKREAAQERDEQAKQAYTTADKYLRDLEQRYRDRMKEQKAAPYERAQRLVPINAQTVKYTSAAFTNKTASGNVLEEGRYTSNGHVALDGDAVPKKNRQRYDKLAQAKGDGVRAGKVQQSAVEQLVEKARADNTRVGVELGVDTEEKSTGGHTLAFVAYQLADGRWKYVAVQAEYLRMFDSIYDGYDEIRLHKQDPQGKAMSIYKDGEQIGIVMPLQLRQTAEIDVDTAIDRLIRDEDVDIEEDTDADELGRAQPQYDEVTQATLEAETDPLNPAREEEGEPDQDVETPTKIGYGLQGELLGDPDVEGISRREVFDMIADVARAAGKRIPLRVGRMGRRNALGIFKVGPEVARILRALDLGTAMHELAHATEKVVFGWPKGGPWKKPRVSGKMQQELVALGKALYGNTKPAGGYKREGFAEFWRRWFENDATLKNDAPEFYVWFEDTFLAGNPELRDAAVRARDGMDRWQRQGSVERVRQSIVDVASPAERLARTRAKVRRIVSMESLVEMGQPLYEMAKRAEEILGRSLTPSENPYTVMSALRTTQAARARYMVERGMIDLAGNKVGPALNDIRPLVEGQQKNFAAFLYAKRAIALWTDPNGRARDPGISLADAQQVVKELGTQEFEKAAAIVYKWADGTLDYAAEASPVFAQVVKRIRKRDPGSYVPLQRIFHELDRAFTRETTDRPMAGPSSPVKRLTGAMRDIKDPLATLIGQTEQLIVASHRRMILDRIIRMANLEGMGDLVEEVPRDLVPELTRQVGTLLDAINQELKGTGAEAILEIDPDSGYSEDELLEALVTFWAPAQFPKGRDPVVSMWDGKQFRWYYVDPKLYDIMASLDIYRLPEWHGINAFEWIAGKPAAAFRAGTTGLRASFGLLWNPVRDIQTMAVNSNANASIPRLLAYWLKSMSDVALYRIGVKEAGEYLDTYLSLGAEMAQALGQDIPHTRLAARRLHQGRTIRTLDPRNWFEFYRDLVQAPEAAPRLAELQATARDIGWEPGQNMTLDQSLQLLLAAKQVTTDFTAAGSLSRMLNRIVPFHNAAIQGPRANLRAARRNPAKFMARGLQLTALSLLLWYENKDKEWYKTLPYRDRYLHWWFDGPEDELIRLPRAFEVGMVFAALPEMALDAWYRQEPEQALRWFETMWQTSRPAGVGGARFGGLPVLYPEMPLAEEILEQAANRDFFFDRPLVPMGEERKPPEEQYSEFTSRAAIMLGDLFNISPRRIDHAIQGVFGYVGGDILDLIGLGPPDVERERELSDLPIVGRAFRRGGEVGTRSLQIDTLYDKLEQAQLRQASDKHPETEEERQQRLLLNDAAQAVTALTYIRARTGSVEQRRAITREAQAIAEAALERIGQPATPEARAPFAESRRQAQSWRDELREEERARRAVP